MFYTTSDVHTPWWWSHTDRNMYESSIF